MIFMAKQTEKASGRDKFFKKISVANKNKRSAELYGKDITPEGPKEPGLLFAVRFNWSLGERTEEQFNFHHFLIIFLCVCEKLHLLISALCN